MPNQITLLDRCRSPGATARIYSRCELIADLVRIYF